MYKPSSNSRQASLFWDLETMLDSKHPLFKLANMIDWSLFEKSFAPLFCADNGRPPKPIRLMTGLLMLKHLRNVSDEQVVAQFTENAYYQYFCGLDAFSTSAPCASSELVHFRHRIGEEGVELILKESIRVNLVIEDRKKEENDRRNGKDGRGRKSDKKNYAWSEPRFKGMAFHVKNVEDQKAVKDCVKGLAFSKWADKLRTTFNNDSVIRIRVEKGIFKKGDNAFVDKMVFKKDTTVQSLKDYPIDDVFGKILKKGPEEYEDVKGLVIADYQNLLEERWIAELRKKYPVVVNKEVLETVNKH